MAQQVAQCGFKYKNIETSATFVIASGAGILHSVTVNTSANTPITVYDNRAASGAPIAVISGGASRTLLYDVIFYSGLTLVTAAAPLIDLTVAYSQNTDN